MMDTEEYKTMKKPKSLKVADIEGNFISINTLGMITSNILYSL